MASSSPEQPQAIPAVVYGCKSSPDERESVGDQHRLVLDALEREGHSRVPFAHREDDQTLGRWVGHQRKMYHRGKLDPERRARLEALPGWTWEARKAGARG
jgi:Helicase associated domain